MAPKSLTHSLQIPDDWDALPADCLCSKITKGTTPPEYSSVAEDCRPFLRVNNLSASDRLNKEGGVLSIRESIHSGVLARSISYPGDVLMNIVGPPLGKTAILDDEYPEYNVNQAIVIYRAKEGFLNQRYLLAYLQCSIAQEWLISRAKKTSGQQNLTIELCKELPVPVPPILEQYKIAKILDAWEMAAEKVENLLENSKAQKKAMMQKLLTGKRRLSGFSHSDWKDYRLGKLFDEREETGCLDLPLASITREQGVIWRDDVGRKDTSSEDKSKYLRICPGDIGYNTMRMWQGVSALSAIEGIVSPAYTIVTPKEGVDGIFMSYLFKLPKIIHDFYRYSQGLTSDTWNLKFRHFNEVKVVIPSLEEQQAIAKVLQTCDQEISKLIGVHKLLVEEKKALMQQLLTGKRRVKVDAP